MFVNPLQFRNAGFARCLGLLLIAFILYGTTVEAAHRHGRVRSGSSDVASLTQSQQTTNPTGGRTSCGDCLICQLHQNFTTTLIALRLNDPPTQVLQSTTAIVVTHLLSRIISPAAGRAPPFVS